MPASCPNCGSDRTRVIETDLTRNGSRRRRHACHDCQHRWTDWQGERPPQGRLSHARPGSRPRLSLTVQQVELVLTSPLSSRALAQQLQRSREAINAIRRGALHAQTLPHLPRRTHRLDQLSCRDCCHWQAGRCQLGFPDPVEEGPGFAVDCNLYATTA